MRSPRVCGMSRACGARIRVCGIRVSCGGASCVTCASPLIKREMQFLEAARPGAPHGPAPAARARRAGRAEGRLTRRGRARSQSAGQDSPASPSEVPGRAAAKPAWEHGLARRPDGHVQVTPLPPGGVGGPRKRGWRRGSSPTPPSGLWAPRWPQRSLTRSSQRSPGGACRPADGPAAPPGPRSAWQSGARSSRPG